MTNAYKIKGLDSNLAVAVGDTAADTELFVHEEEGGQVPAEVQKFIDAGNVMVNQNRSLGSV